jgi:hypothetical protein
MELPVPVTTPVVVFPLATPSTFQVTAALEAPDTVAVNSAAAPVFRLEEVGVKATLTVEMGTWTVMTAAAALVPSATLMASRVWLPADVGAVYTTVLPLPVTVPTVALPLGIASTVQLTAVFAAFDTVAVKDWVAPVAREVFPGLKATPTILEVATTFTLEEACLLESARLVAVKV